MGRVLTETPRDRNSRFRTTDHQKHQTRFDGFDDKILVAVRAGHDDAGDPGRLREMCGVDVGQRRRFPALPEGDRTASWRKLEAWQNRPLEPVYGVAYPDALYVKMRHEGRVENRAVYVAIGIGPGGTEGRAGARGCATARGPSSGWEVLTELKEPRGARMMLIACVDGLQGASRKRSRAYSLAGADVLLCIVHLVAGQA